MGNFMNRILRAAKLDVNLYEEVEADTGATRQAMGVVVLGSVAAGLGAGRGSPGGMLIGAVFALIAWFVWAYLTYWIGTRVLPEPQTSATHGELLRTIGFASSPGILRVLGVIPGLREVVFLVAGIWMLVATVIAVRQALDYRGTLRAVGVCAIGWLVQMVILTIVALLLGGGGRPA
ncbi:MAG: YIP1 family protein [Candidatus Methylomirabilia bacterium]